MGQTNRVACSCGFTSSVTIGGGMRTYLEDSRFPFYCKFCGLVDVNVAGTELVCPNCESQDVLPYGKPPISIEQVGHACIEWNPYKAYKTGNLCPQCKKMTLEFRNTEMMFD